jgi:hypothetical protein
MRIGDVSVISLAWAKKTFRIDTDRPAQTFQEHQLARRSIQKAVGCLDVRMVQFCPDLYGFSEAQKMTRGKE